MTEIFNHFSHKFSPFLDLVGKSHYFSFRESETANAFVHKYIENRNKNKAAKIMEFINASHKIFFPLDKGLCCHNVSFES